MGSRIDRAQNLACARKRRKSSGKRPGTIPALAGCIAYHL